MAILERALVTAAENMSDKIFAMHMRKRHPESIGYIRTFPISDKTIMRMWRSFHGHLHRWRIDIRHEHGEP
jgi:hypothetical protein